MKQTYSAAVITITNEQLHLMEDLFCVKDRKGYLSYFGEALNK